MLHCANSLENIIVKRGDIWIADLVESYKYVVKGKRPVIILSNWAACNNSPLINAIPITSKTKSDLPSHVKIGNECGLDLKSIALCEQPIAINKENLIYQIGKCTYIKMKEIKRAIDSQFGFMPNSRPEILSEVNRMVQNIQELDRFLNVNFDKEIFAERKLLHKNLENYCVNNSVDIDLSIFDYKEWWGSNVKSV